MTSGAKYYNDETKRLTHPLDRRLSDSVAAYSDSRHYLLGLGLATFVRG